MKAHDERVQLDIWTPKAFPALKCFTCSSSGTKNKNMENEQDLLPRQRQKDNSVLWFAIFSCILLFWVLGWAVCSSFEVILKFCYARVPVWAVVGTLWCATVASLAVHFSSPWTQTCFHLLCFINNNCVVLLLGFWVHFAIFIFIFFLFQNWAALCSLVYLPPLMTKWNKDSFVSTLHFPVAIKPDSILTHGKGMRWGFSEPISDYTMWICMYCNDCTCPANCWNTAFPVEPKQSWREPRSVSRYVSISSSQICFRHSVEHELDFWLNLIQSWLQM